MKLHNMKNYLAVSALAGLTFSASAQLELNSFAFDLIESTVAVETQHAAPRYEMPFAISAIDLSAFETPSAGLNLSFGQGTDRVRGFEAITTPTLGSVQNTTNVGSAHGSVGNKTQVVPVPLPSAALAGFGLICGIAGIRSIRSRR